MNKPAWFLLNLAMTFLVTGIFSPAHADVRKEMSMMISVEAGSKDFFAVSDKGFTLVGVHKREKTTYTFGGQLIPESVIPSPTIEETAVPAGNSYVITNVPPTRDPNGLDKQVGKNGLPKYFIAHLHANFQGLLNSVQNSSVEDAQMILNEDGTGWSFTDSAKNEILSVNENALRSAIPEYVNKHILQSYQEFNDQPLIAFFKPVKPGFIVDRVEDSRRYQSCDFLRLGDGRIDPLEEGKMVIVHECAYTITISGHYLKQGTL